MSDEDTEVTDLERVGLFVDGPYDTDVTLYRVHDFVTIMGRDDPPKGEDPDRLDGPFPIIPGHKTKAATNDWAFDEEFRSLWEDVPYEDPGTWRRNYIQEQKELIRDGDFYPGGAAKLMNGSGTLYGTFMEGKDYEAFSTETRDKPENDLEGVAQILTSPGKKGSGYGYVDVCLNPYPEHMDDPIFDQLEARREMREAFEGGVGDKETFIPPGPPHPYFDKNPYTNSKDPDGQDPTYDFSRLTKWDVPNDPDKPPFLPSTPGKKIAGNKDVILPLERFPEYLSDPYEDIPYNIFRQTKPDPDKPIYKPPIRGNRTRQTRSILNQNINFRINSTNFHLF